MQSAIGGALRTVLKPIARPSCVFVGGARHSLSRHSFHSTPAVYRIPDSQGSGGPEKDITAPDDPKNPRGENVDGDVAAASPSVPAVDSTKAAKKAPQASGRLRPHRHQQPKGLPPVIIPDWFLEKNVKRVEDRAFCGSLAVYALDNTAPPDETATTELNGHDSDTDIRTSSALSEAEYAIHANVYREILFTLKAALTLRPPHIGKSFVRPAIHLYCPKDGATYFLDSVVETMASKLGADLVRLDAQDIAMIVGPYIDENLAFLSTSPTSHLGYSTQKAAGNHDKYLINSPEDFEEEDTGSRLDSLLETMRQKGFATESAMITKVRTRLAVEHGLSADMKTQIGQIPQIKLNAEDWDTLKGTAALDALVGAADSKRGPCGESESPDTHSTQTGVRDVIIQVKDYKELEQIPPGPSLLRALRSVINKRWRDGRNIVLVGTTSVEDIDLSRQDIRALQFQAPLGEKKTIFVPPYKVGERDISFEADNKARIRQMNIRHIEDMVLRLYQGNLAPDLVVDVTKDLDTTIAYSAGLEDTVWEFHRVHRLATIMLGLNTSPTHIDGPVFGRALKLLSDSDDVKVAWCLTERRRERDLAHAGQPPADTVKDKVARIRKNCSSYEKKLLSGVRSPSEIHATFNDVHAPKETIEALKTLTSLSLARPEAFSYGVLATDNIPGLLLYGPPGTGKTLLAKAVAKESGAIMLDVSGASVNDKYVGEGEKNVKAIFSLARKLSPCVVFIDEADALLASRGDSVSKRTSHREVINEFLREWDGMNDHSAFIMVATNRPFDLDEAILRRLPRRLLVDLPIEKDRASILSIHLKGEILAPSVSIPDLAKDTPYYSGSDLKNVCVAAAMACLREENALAAAHTGDQPFVYPEKRVLTKKHFDSALDEISASISEDMSSLKAVRKFDEKYGDRKGRRKKSATMGFGGTTVDEVDSEAGRVRKIAA